jgi:hypothetical protein
MARVGAGDILYETRLHLPRMVERAGSSEVKIWIWKHATVLVEQRPDLMLHFRHTSDGRISSGSDALRCHYKPHLGLISGTLSVTHSHTLFSRSGFD